MNILSCHSSVAMGSVGNSGAAFALRRLGHETWPINTVALSNHPAHGGFRGRVTPAAEIADLVQGLAERGALARCDAVLSGYLGAPEQGPAIADAVAAVRAANPRALWLLDPVIGDGDGADGRIYVKPGIAEFLRDRAVREADILTPNAFELAFLSGIKSDSTATALDAIDSLRTRSRSATAVVVVTGLRLRDGTPGEIAMVAVEPSAAWRISVPYIDHPAHGAGDLFAAVLLARLLGGDPLSAAVAHAAAAVHGIIARTGTGAADLALVAAQEELVSPRRHVDPVRLR